MHSGLLEIQLVGKSFNHISLCQDHRRAWVLRSDAPIYTPNPLPDQDRWTNSNACFKSADADHAIFPNVLPRSCGGGWLSGSQCRFERIPP
jgi:hypothetical protein